MRNHSRTERLIIFSRYPICGKTKTRLIPELGKAGAADLQRRLTEYTYRIVKALAARRRIHVEVRFEGGSGLKMRQWLGRDAIYSNQPRGSLGNRMCISFAEAFRKGCGAVVLIGSDIPGLSPGHLEQAFDRLNEYDLVLGPSDDGGYWLVGMKSHHDIFRGIDWGTDAVLNQSLNAAKEMGLKIFLLDPLRDIDTFDDLRKWDTREAETNPYVSVIIPTLNEAKTIEKAIQSAVNQDAEVIVVDGGSSDHTVKKAQAAGARVETSDPGRAVQQNMGAASALGKALLFLHADTILPYDYVDHVFGALMDPETVAGAFRFKTDWDRPAMRVVEFLTNFRANHLKLPYGDQGLFVRRSAFLEMGGFPKVPIAEDLQIIRQLSRRGRISIAPALAITSARRWQRLGVMRTTLINQLILAGCFLRISPEVLATLYRRPKKSNDKFNVLRK